MMHSRFNRSGTCPGSRRAAICSVLLGGFAVLTSGAVLLAQPLPAKPPLPAAVAEPAPASSGPATRASDRYPRGLTRMPDGKLVFNFRDARIDDIIDAFGRGSGFTVQKDVAIEGSLPAVVALRPIDVEEAIELLNVALADRGYSIIRQGDTVRIVSQAQAQANARAFFVMGAIGRDADGFLAYVEDRAHGTIRKIRAGDEIAGGRVSDITADEVRYQVDDKLILIKSGQNLEGESAAAISGGSK